MGLKSCQIFCLAGGLVIKWRASRHGNTYRFAGDSTFDDNWGYLGGAIYNDADASLNLPEDGGELIFQNVRGEVSNDLSKLALGGYSFCTLCTLANGSISKMTWML